VGVGDGGHSGGDALPEQDADRAAEEAEHDGFDEELEEDGGGSGADGLAEADLAGAFGDGDEHDVHDADATDEEGDADDATAGDLDVLAIDLNCWTNLSTASTRKVSGSPGRMWRVRRRKKEISARASSETLGERLAATTWKPE
jgi:hypothetical protein